ncbi:MAG: sulfotransferase domain-containing protein [Chitinophagales bacterium]
MKEIFFHVGLGKTASTYLQNKVFNKLKGLEYIHPTRYKKAFKIIDGSNAEKILLSREMDRQLEREVKKFSLKYPDTKAIMVLRSNDSWIASQYRRFLKNGYPYTFTQYFDIENDKGYWKISDALFFPKIMILEKYFTQKPLILFYEDMRKDTFSFIDRITKYTGTTYSKDEISLEPHHTSYEEKQLKIMLKVAPGIFTKDPQYKGSAFNIWLRRRSRMLLCYIILYAALLVPKRFVSKTPLIPKEELEKVKQYFKEDWEKCIRYAEENRL